MSFRCRLSAASTLCPAHTLSPTHTDLNTQTTVPPNPAPLSSYTLRLLPLEPTDCPAECTLSQALLCGRSSPRSPTAAAAYPTIMPIAALSGSCRRQSVPGDRRKVLFVRADGAGAAACRRRVHRITPPPKRRWPPAKWAPPPWRPPAAAAMKAW